MRCIFLKEPKEYGPFFGWGLSRRGLGEARDSPQSPWEHGYVESFHDKFRDEPLNRELSLHLDELRYVVDRWRMDYNHYRPHSLVGYMSPAVFAASCVEADSAMRRQSQHSHVPCHPVTETGT